VRVNALFGKRHMHINLAFSDDGFGFDLGESFLDATYYA
jgi:hypothetical protein